MNTLQNDLREKDIKPQGMFNSIGLMNNLPNLLRLLGAAALMFAMYSFLAKGWQSGNDVFRYLLMLGHTGALAAIGLASGYYLKESKGARLLLTLALVSVPVNFAILGSFIYSQAAAINISNYPHYVSWTVDSLNTALFTSGGSMLALVPIIFLGFTVLARSMSIKLSLLFLFSNAALLLPLRDPQMIGILVLALTLCTILFTRKVANNQTAAKTQEGIIALALQLLPLSVLIVRSLWLYSLDAFLLAVLFVTVYFILRQISLYLEASSKLRNLLDSVSVIPALLTSLPLGSALITAANFPEALVLPISAITSAAMVYDISRRNQSRAGTYRQIAISCLLLGMGINLTLFTGLFAALSCVVVGLALLVYGYYVQQRSVFTGGIALIIIGMLQQFFELVHHFDLGNWASFATLGIVTIVIASVMESQGGKIKNRINTWKTSFHQWEQ